MIESRSGQTTVPGSGAINTTSTKRRRSDGCEGAPVSDLGKWRRGTGPEPENWDFNSVFGAPPDDRATWDPEEFDDESGCRETFQCASPDTMTGDQEPKETGSESDPANAFDKKHDVGTATEPQGQDPSNTGDTTPSQADGLTSRDQAFTSTGQAPPSTSGETGRRLGGTNGPRTTVPWKQQRQENCRYISERERNALKEGPAEHVGSAGKRSTRTEIDKYTR